MPDIHVHNNTNCVNDRKKLFPASVHPANNSFKIQELHNRKHVNMTQFVRRLIHLSKSIKVFIRFKGIIYKLKVESVYH